MAVIRDSLQEIVIDELICNLNEGLGLVRVC